MRMVAPHLVLASASETRLRVLREGGFDPIVDPAHVDETHHGRVDVAVGELAERKASAVAPRHPDAVVLGCDSLVAVGDRVLGKPSSPDEAVEWWRFLRGRTATVWTGHHVVRGERAAGRTLSATLRFRADVSDAEIDAYVASGDGMRAAGGFRLHGRSGAFIDSIDGHPGTISGVALPALRELLRALDVTVVQLWS
jgi:septum formation protein